VSPTLVAIAVASFRTKSQSPAIHRTRPGFVGRVANYPGSNSSEISKVHGGHEASYTDIPRSTAGVHLAVSPNTQWTMVFFHGRVDEFPRAAEQLFCRIVPSRRGIVSLTIKSGTKRTACSGYDFLTQTNHITRRQHLGQQLQGLKKSIDTQTTSAPLSAVRSGFQGL